jgi:hypothetical protein
MVQLLVDAGVVTGATSITSTAFVGDVTGDVTGNADTATVLATARTIGGVSFNGSANIDLPGVNSAGNQNTSGSAATLTTARTIGGTSFDGSANIAVALATLATTATVSDSTANTNFPVVFNDESNALLDDTGALRYNPSTGTLLVPNLVVAGTTTQVDTVTMEAANAIVFEGATADAYETTLTIVDPTGDRTINLPNVSGTIPVLAAASTTQVTSTPEELNILDGATVVVGEINALDLGSTAVGTAIASKAVILDSNKDYTGVRNFTLSGELDAGSLDVSGDVDVDGTLEADAITVNGTALAEFISDTAGAMVSSNTETGITVTYQDADNTIDFAINAAQTTITSLLATDIKIGEDDQTKIDFETADEIHFYAANAHQIKLVDGALVPATDNDVDLGTSSVEFKDAYFDGTVTADAFSGPINGDLTGTLQTAAQANVTSLGTLTALTVDNIIINGTNIGHTSDTDSIAIASDGVVTFSQAPVFPDGSIAVADLDIDGATDIGAAIVDADLFIVDDGAGGTNRKTTAARLKTYINAGVSSAADDISAGDGAVNITTSSGNITIDAAANDSDIIFKGTDGGADITMLTLDGSADGAAIFKSTVTATGIIIGSTAVTSTAAELNILDGVTSTAAELNVLDGITAVVGELNALDLGSTAVGNAIASKAVILDSNKDYTGIRNLTISGQHTLGTNSSGNSAAILQGTGLNFKLNGDTASQLSVVSWTNNSGTQTGNIWGTGDSSGSTVLRVKSLGIIDLVPGGVGIDGTEGWRHTTSSLTAPNSAGPALLNETASSTNPTLVPNKADLDTGVGWASANVLTVVTGGSERMRIAADGVVTFSEAPVFPDGSIAVADLDIDGATDIGAAIVDADLFIVDDGAGGTNRKTTAARLKTYIDAASAPTQLLIKNASGTVVQVRVGNATTGGTDVEIQNSAGTALLSMKGAFSNAQETVSTSADTGSSWTIIESGTSKASGEYIDISGYKHVKFWAINDESTNAGIREAAHLSTSGSSNSGVSTEHGRWWRTGNSATSAFTSATGAFSPATSSLYYGANSSDDTNHLWEAEFWGMDQTNVGIRTQQRSGAGGTPDIRWNQWMGRTTSGSSSWYLYTAGAWLNYQIWGAN